MITNPEELFKMIVKTNGDPQKIANVCFGIIAWSKVEIGDTIPEATENEIKNINNARNWLKAKKWLDTYKQIMLH